MQFGALSVPGNGVGFNMLDSGSLNISPNGNKGFNPIDPSSFDLGNGFDFTQDAFLDGEPVKGSYRQAQFADGSQFNILSARMLAFVCSGFSTTSENSVILLNLGWKNNFSKIHFERAKTSTVRILKALRAQLTQDNNHSAVAGSSRSNERLRSLLGGIPKDSSSVDLVSSHKLLSETIFSETAKIGGDTMDYELLLFWSNFTDYIGAESVLVDVMRGLNVDNVTKYMMGYEPLVRTSQRPSEEFSALQKKYPIFLDSALKHSSKYPTHTRLEKIDPIDDATKSKAYNPNVAKKLLKLDDQTSLASIKTWDDLIDFESIVRKKQDGAFDQLLRQFIASRQIPMGYAYDPKTPVSLHLLFKTFHDEMFKFLGVVEDIMENRETRSVGGHQMFGTPPMTIVTERVVEAWNVWGVPLKVGQPLYLVKTRKLISPKDRDELTNGSWMHVGKPYHYQTGNSRQFYGHFSTNAQMLRFDPKDTWGKHHQTNMGFPSSVTNNVSSNQKTILIEFGSDKDDDDSLQKKIAIDKIERGSITRSNWGEYDALEKLDIAWNRYGEWIELPICGLTEDAINRYYGYPDIFGRWNNPDILKIGIVKSVNDCLTQNTDAVRHVVSGTNLDSSVSLTREEMLNKTSMLDHFIINLDSKLQRKMTMM